MRRENVSKVCFVYHLYYYRSTLVLTAHTGTEPADVIVRGTESAVVSDEDDDITDVF